MPANRLLLSFVLFILYHSSAVAQTTSISGAVTASESPAIAATVSLLNATDSSWLRSELTDDSGHFMFNNIVAGTYLLSISSIGFATSLRKITTTLSNEPLAINLEPAGATLNGVTVTARKPFIEMSLGKLTVNIEGSAGTAGTNVLDLMRRLPGLSVGPDGSISMHGKQGVLVLIDDRPTYLSGEQLAEYLKTITANELSQLEIITQPGAKYDAAGNTGVINIRLRKNRRLGFNGSASLALGKSLYANEHSSLQLDYGHNKLSISLTASDAQAKGFGDWQESQYARNAATGITTGTASIHSAAWERFGISSSRLAADYTLSDKTTIGTSIRATYHPNDTHGSVFSTRTDLPANTLIYNEVRNPEGFIRKDAIANGYLSHRLSKTSTIDLNLDYLTYINDARQDVTSINYDASMLPMPNPLILHSNQPSAINILSARADHSYTPASGISLESGLKTSFVTTDNNAQFTLLQNNQWIADTMRSNRFRYREQINAAYATASKNLGSKWQAKAGLRAEQTLAQGTQYVHNNNFSRNYLSLFPTAYITYKADSNNQLELNYGRRIDRPAYRTLNPFIYYSFQYSYTVGNPYLLPQYTNTLELKHSYKNLLISGIDVSATTDVMNDVLALDSASGKVYSTTKNVASCKSADAYVIFNKDLYKWWSVNASVYVFYSAYSGVLSGKQTNLDGIGYSFHLSTQLDCGKGWKTEFNGYYNNDNIQSLIQKYGTQLYTSLGVSKKFNEHFTARLLLNDPFYLCRQYTYTYLDNFYSSATFRNATQEAVAELRYTFGTIQAAARKAQRIDETSRMKIDQ